MKLRKIIFWFHLIVGLAVGLVVGIMSFTGVLIAFEHEITEWIDRDVIHLSESDMEGTVLPIGSLLEQVSMQEPEFNPTQILIPKSPDEAYLLRAGRSGMRYVNPYDGRIRPIRSQAAHDFLHTMEAWHRWLGMTGKARSVGKWITGVCNFGFLLLCISGLYLWFPKKWTRKLFRYQLWFSPKFKGKSRDLNWHNVLGFWNLPVLLILVGTAVVFSFQWAHNLVFQLAGEDPASHRGPGMLGNPKLVLDSSAYEDGAMPISLDEGKERVLAAYPNWQSVGINLSKTDDFSKPMKYVVFEPAPFSTRGRIQVDVHPMNGDILQTVGFKDRSPGVQARIWIRFLHTGEAFGMVGKVIAVISTALSLVLVYTGFALSWRRFF